MDGEDFVPRRWDGSRCTDWVLCIRTYWVWTICMISGRVTRPCVATSLASCVLPQAVAFQDTKPHRWSCPLGVSRKVLTEKLEVAWQNAHVTVTGNTDEEWSAFCSLAEDLFGQIFRKYSGGTRLAGTTRPKGSLPRPKPGQIGRTSASFARSFAAGKIRNDLQRLLEVQRKPEQCWRPDERSALLAKVYARQQLSETSSLEEAIALVQTRLGDQYNIDTAHAIQQ